MYSAVHSDGTGRVLVSRDDAAAGSAGTGPGALIQAIPLPPGTRLLPLSRDAIAMGRTGRPRPLGRGRRAVGALLPLGYARTLFPAYRDDPASAALDPLPYAAVAADERGDLVVAAVSTGAATARAGDAPAAPGDRLLRAHPANALARQLARCARDHECSGARSIPGAGELPVPLGAPSAERPTLPLDLRSGYAGAPIERAAFTPTAAEILELAADHFAGGGRGVAFGRACDGEPLARVRVLEDAIRAIRGRSPGAVIHLETSGSDAVALRRAIDAGLGSLTLRLASARGGTYELIHGPVAHRWADVRACFEVAASRGVALTVAILSLPGLTDRAEELDAFMELLGDLPGGRLELRELGADPVRVLAALPRGRTIGVAGMLARIAEADHFPLRPPTERAAVL